jgi:hypothetical protein
VNKDRDFLKNRLTHTISELRNFKLRPWNILKYMKLIKDTQITLTGISIELLKLSHVSVDGIENSICIDMSHEQRIDNLWAEVYRLGEEDKKRERKLMELEGKWKKPH